MDDRPDYVTCIARTHTAHLGESWCGRRISMEFHFTGLDHAAENGKNQGRLVACPACVSAAVQALRNGHDDSGVPEAPAPHPDPFIEHFAKAEAEQVHSYDAAGVMAAPTPKPVAMIDAADARRLADELEKLRCDHWTHWSAQENHVAATAVRHLRLLAEHNAPGVLGTDETGGTDGR